MRTLPTQDLITEVIRPDLLPGSVRRLKADLHTAVVIPFHQPGLSVYPLPYYSSSPRLVKTCIIAFILAYYATKVNRLT